MEKQVLLAVFLSLLVLFAFKYCQAYRTTRALKMRRPAQAAVARESTPISPSETRAPAETIAVDGGLYRATLDRRGALLTGWELKKYKSAGETVFDMIAQQDAGQRPYPGSLLLEDPALSALANSAPYEVRVAPAPRSSGTLAPPATVVLRLARGDLLIEKRYQFEGDSYLLDFSLTIEKGGWPLTGRILVGQDIGGERERLLSRSDRLEAVSYRDGKVRRENADGGNEVKKSVGEVRWVGLDTQYFAAVAIPDQPLAWFDLQRFPTRAADAGGKERTRDLVRIAIPQTGSAKFRMYLGPKERASLKAVKGVDLTRLIHYRTFSFLVPPLLLSLQWINRYVCNYGFSIVVLTFFLNLLLFPFRLKQMISMKKMAAVQPKIKAIQEKYRRYGKTDPRRLEMNREIMALYREHHVHPLGGCLPMILQAPLLLAFYALLAYSIELRRAPFMGWIRDLSAKDPFYVLPILMGISTFISQAMTPAQDKFMKLVLPLVLTYMFLNYSSGLNLYFLCSNLFQIGFQKIGDRCIRRRALS